MHRFAITILTAVAGFAALNLPSMLQAESLSLEVAVQKTLSQNPEIQAEAIERLIQKQSIVLEESRFDPSLFANMERRTQRDPSLTEDPNSTQLATGLRKLLSSGANVTLQTRYGRDENAITSSTIPLNENSHSARLSIELRQPLLKGLGQAVSRAGIRKAQTQLLAAELLYKSALAESISQTEQAYWQVSFQQARLELSHSSIQLAQNLLSETEKKEQQGIANRLDLLQAQANLANQQEQHIDAASSLDLARDHLGYLMGSLSQDLQSLPLSVAALPDPGWQAPSLGELWPRVVEKDFNLRIKEAQLEALGYDHLRAKDEKRAELDLILSATSYGLSDRSANQAWDDMGSGKSGDWKVGVEYTLPIGQRGGRARLTQVQAQIAQAKLRMSAAEQQLLQEARSQLRSYASSREKLHAARISLELEKQAFRQAQLKYSEGMATFLEIQQAQESLNRAELNELSARLAALKAQSELFRLDGSLLERYRISVSES
jgi:outer membrane protein TolC